MPQPELFGGRAFSGVFSGDAADLQIAYVERARQMLDLNARLFQAFRSLLPTFVTCMWLTFVACMWPKGVTMTACQSFSHLSAFVCQRRDCALG